MTKASRPFVRSYIYPIFDAWRKHAPIPDSEVMMAYIRLVTIASAALSLAACSPPDSEAPPNPSAEEIVEVRTTPKNLPSAVVATPMVTVADPVTPQEKQARERFEQCDVGGLVFDDFTLDMFLSVAPHIYQTPIDVDWFSFDLAGIHHGAQFTFHIENARRLESLKQVAQVLSGDQIPMVITVHADRVTLSAKRPGQLR